MGIRFSKRTAVAATALTAGALLAGSGVASAADATYRCPARACFVVAEGVGNPEGVAVTQSGDTAYVADSWSDTVFKVDVASRTKTGLVKNIDAHGIALDASGTTAYVSDYHRDAVFEIDLESGRQTTLTSSINDPRGMAVTGDGTTAYVASPSDNVLYEVDTKTGQTTRIASNIDAVGVAEDGLGNAYVTTVDDDSLYRVDIRSGRVARVAQDLGDPNGVVLDGAGNAFVTSYSHDKLYKVNPQTGARTEVATNLDGAEAVALDGTGRLFVTTDGGDKLWAVDYVAAPPVRHSAEVVSDGAGAAHPGGFAHPAVKVTNTGKSTIGSERVDVTASPGTKIASEKVGWWSNGSAHYHQCTRSVDKMKLSCEGVNLDIAPGQKAKVWVTTRVDDGTPAGSTAKAGFSFGEPVFAKGESSYTVTAKQQS